MSNSNLSHSAVSDGTILTLNAGSSSIKFAIFEIRDEPLPLARGQIENLGPAARLIIERDRETERLDIGAADHGVALQAILERLADLFAKRPVRGIGHRIVHGGIDFDAPVVLDPPTLQKLRALQPLAPLHQPHNLHAAKAAIEAFPEALQIGCFDTAFHHGHPWVNDTFALPRRYYDQGVRRYGFHGLSYQYITSALPDVAPDIARSKVVIAHLGNGASMCAVMDGKSIGSTMGFSALDGLPMGTRCGQLDPGVMLYLLDHEGMSAAQISDLLYKESGLLGLSGLSHDMRTLEQSESDSARQAIDYYVFRIRRELGAMAAVLGGIDALVFSGGIGENSAMIRERVCANMTWLGISIDPNDNARNHQDIGTGAVRVMVVPTNEELVIARDTAKALARRVGAHC